MRAALHPFLSASPVRVWVRRITRGWHWTTALCFLAYAWLNDEPHPLLRRLLIFIAIAEVVAITLESACRRIDEAEARALRDEMERMKREVRVSSEMAAELRAREVMRSL